MVRPSRRGRNRALLDSETTTPVVDGDDIDWPGGVYTPTPSEPADQWKQPVIAATTADITIATALNDADTLDGVTLATGDRVLVKDQTLDYENGIYVVGSTPERAVDFDDPEEVPGAVVLVIDGTANGGSAFRAENITEPVVDADAITFTAFGSGSGASFATPAIVLGTAAAAGAASTVIRSDSTIVAFDATLPVASGGSGATGSAAIAARRDHKHPVGTSGIIAVVDGGGATITTGVKLDLQIPFACTITSWTILLDQSGSIVIDIWKDTLANYPPVIGDVITASAKPTVTTATNATSSTLTGWTTSITAGDTLRFNVNSVTTAQRATLTLYVTRT